MKGVKIQYRKLGRLLFEGRERKGIPPESAVMQLGLTNRQYLWRCENGHSNFPVGRLRKALELYEIPISHAVSAASEDFNESMIVYLRKKR